MPVIDTELKRGDRVLVRRKEPFIARLVSVNGTTATVRVGRSPGVFHEVNTKALEYRPGKQILKRRCNKVKARALAIKASQTTERWHYQPAIREFSLSEYARIMSEV